MDNQDIRWKQRFQNFEKSLLNLESGLSLDSPSLIEKAGLIQFFEICFEQSWKVLKEYLAAQGLADVKYPRESIKKAFETELISNGQTWLEALNNRNISSHTYDDVLAEKVVAGIRTSYYPMLKELYDRLKQEV